MTSIAIIFKLFTYLSFYLFQFYFQTIDFFYQADTIFSFHRPIFPMPIKFDEQIVWHLASTRQKQKRAQNVAKQTWLSFIVPPKLTNLLPRVFCC